MIVNQEQWAAPGPIPPRQRLSPARAAITGVIVGIIGFAAFTVPIPMLMLHPGPTPGVFDLVHVDAEITPASGTFHITTVCLSEAPRLVDLVRAWASPRVVVISRSALFPPGKSREEVGREQETQMEDSKIAAAVAALRELGYEAEPESVMVLSTQVDTPSAEVLQSGDVILAIDGNPITTRQQVGERIRERQVGETVNVQVRRDDEVKDFVVGTEPGPDGSNRPFIGVELSQRYTLPIAVEVDSGNIGGPSAGLMFAVGIVDQLDAADLTHGLTIAGTGAIDGDGNVGQVGGVEQKVEGARRTGATYFFVPDEEAQDAVDAAPPGMTVIGVKTLHEAVLELRELATPEDSGNPNSGDKQRAVKDCSKPVFSPSDAGEHGVI